MTMDKNDFSSLLNKQMKKATGTAGSKKGGGSTGNGRGSSRTSRAAESAEGQRAGDWWPEHEPRHGEPL